MDLDQLCEPAFWKGVGQDEAVQLTIILPTGRALESVSPHLALATDALLLPEITLAIDRIAREAGLRGANVESILDIDFYESHLGRKGVPSGRNLLLVGSADVNLATAILLDTCRSYETYRAGYTKPYEHPSIIGVNKTRYTFTTAPRAGVTAMYPNPWVKEGRFALLCAGLLAVGSVAALRLVLEYLMGNRHGNNRFDSATPVKIVSGVPRVYRTVELKPIDDCSPQMDLLNISAIQILE